MLAFAIDFILFVRKRLYIAQPNTNVFRLPPIPPSRVYDVVRNFIAASRRNYACFEIKDIKTLYLFQVSRKQLKELFSCRNFLVNADAGGAFTFIKIEGNKRTIRKKKDSLFFSYYKKAS